MKNEVLPPNVSLSIVNILQGVIGCLHFTNVGFKNKPELFVGYESGAIGAFRFWLDDIHENKISFSQVISTQKMIQDPNVHHILSMEAIYLKPGDLKLAVGYYSPLLQTLDFTSASDFDSYILVSQKQTSTTYSEKPGIGCL